MVKKHAKNIVLILAVFAIMLVIFLLDSHKQNKENSKLNTEISYKYGNTDILPTVETAIMENGKSQISIYSFNKNGEISILDASPITGGSVKESDMSEFRQRFGLTHPDDVIKTYGNMLFFHENNGHKTLIFNKEKECVVTYDDKMTNIPLESNSSVFTANYNDEYCMISHEDKIYSLKYDTMEYETYNKISLDSIPDVNGSLTYSLLVDKDLIIYTRFIPKESILSIVNYKDNTVKDIHISGKVVSLTLNDDKKTVTVISTNADSSDMFSEISVYNLPLNEDVETLNPVFTSELPDGKQVFFDNITQSVRKGNIISILSQTAGSENTEETVICVNTDTEKIEAMMSMRFLTDVIYFNSVLNY